MSEVECVVDARCWLGEGPAWHPDESALYFVDAPGKRIHRWSPKTGEHVTFEAPEVPTAVIVRENGGLLAVLASRIDFFDQASGAFTPFLAPEAGIPANRSNDAKCDASGRLWYGTMQNNFAEDMSEAPITGSSGWLYRIEADGRTQRMDGPFGISNTFAWSPDDRTMYFGDTLANKIYAYDFESVSGTIVNRRDFAKADGPGFGDGSAMDADGFLWNARWDGGCVIRFAPDGSVDRVVKMPCRRVTSCCFGGDDLSTLYVTSVRYGLSALELAGEPLAGGLFAFDPGVKGLPVGRFAG